MRAFIKCFFMSIALALSYMQATNGNRTRDLILTKDALYRLSHSSIWLVELGVVLPRQRMLCYQRFFLLSTTQNIKSEFSIDTFIHVLHECFSF